MPVHCELTILTFPFPRSSTHLNSLAGALKVRELNEHDWMNVSVTVESFITCAFALKMGGFWVPGVLYDMKLLWLTNNLKRRAHQYQIRVC